MFRKIIAFLLLSFFVISQVQANKHGEKDRLQLKNQQQAFITVGAGVTCDYDGIQAAIDSGDSDVIRIASDKVYYEQIAIYNKSIDLIGGYANCIDAENNMTDLSQAIISGFGSGVSLTIEDFNNYTHEVLIRNLWVGNSYRGIWILTQHPSNTVNVTLDNVRSYNNIEYGVYISAQNGSKNHVVMNNSKVDFNGGSGIFCEAFASEGSLILTGETIIAENQSSGYGGGVSVNIGCDLTVYSPVEISNNQAESGGGVAVSGGSVTLFGGAFGCDNGICYGEWTRPVLVSENIASKGGGIFIHENSWAILANVLVANNTGFFGGGLHVSDSSVIAIGVSSLEDECWSPGACLQFKNNSASLTSGAIYSDSGSNVDISGALITKNRSSGAMIAKVLADGELNIANSVITDNGQVSDSGSSLFAINDNGSLTLEYATIAANYLNPDFGAVIANEGSGEVNVFSSIVLDEQLVYKTSGLVQPHFECVMVRERASFGGDDTVTVVTNDLAQIFVDSAQGDYHLTAGSPAIDYCYDIEGSTIDEDLDGETRGTDHSGTIDFFGTYDIGAYEFDEDDIFDDDLIFKNGFE